MSSHFPFLLPFLLLPIQISLKRAHSSSRFLLSSPSSSFSVSFACSRINFAKNGKGDSRLFFQPKDRRFCGEEEEETEDELA